MLGTYFRRFFAFFILALFVSASVFAWAPTWGTELTFTREDLRHAAHVDGDVIYPQSDENYEALHEFKRLARKVLKGRKDVASVKLHEADDKWGHDYLTVTYKDGFFFEVTLDPYCLEVMLKPTTREDLLAHEKIIQSDLFDLMATLDLIPHRHEGGGHLHMGAESSFGQDVLLFRNWIVDQANHSELALGAMEKDRDNAEALVNLSRAQREELARIIAEVDAKMIKTPRKLATALYARVFFEGKPATGARIMAAKYWQVNALRMAYLDTWDTLDANERWKDYEAWILYDEVEKKARTIENRALRSQMNARELMDDVTLFEKRLVFLKSLNRPIPLSQDFIDGKLPSLQQATQQFYQFVVQSGCDPKDYLSRLPQKGDPGLRQWRGWGKEYRKLIKKQTCASALLLGS